MAKRIFLIGLLGLALAACPQPKDPEKDGGGKGDGPAVSDGPKAKEAGKKDAGKDAPGGDAKKKPDANKPDANKSDAKKPDANGPDASKLDAKKPDASGPDLPSPTDGPISCDAAKGMDGAGACCGGCYIKGSCVKVGAPFGDPCKTCDPAFSRYFWAPKKGCVVTIAGTGTAGYKDGDVHTAQFREPGGIVVDTKGTIYVSDTENCVVRKISGGQVSTIGVQTLYSSGNCGHKDGAFSVAKFSNPSGLALGPAGEIYVADGENDQIRMIQNGTVKTFAGIGSCGDTNAANPKLAELCDPEGVVTDGKGAVYISEFGNHMVRKVSTAGVSKVAGTDRLLNAPQAGFKDGPAGTALFNELSDILFLPGNLVLVAERQNHVIRQIDLTSKVVSVFAGTTPTNPGTFPTPTTFPGCKDDTDPLKAMMQKPEAMAWDATNKRVYFWGSQNNCLRMVQLPGKAVTTLNGMCRSGGLSGSTCRYVYADGDLLTTAGFNGPEGMFVDSKGRIFVSDTGNDMIRVINPY